MKSTINHVHMEDYNWNYLDQHVCGIPEFEEYRDVSVYIEPLDFGGISSSSSNILHYIVINPMSGMLVSSNVCMYMYVISQYSSRVIYGITIATKL